VFHLLARSPCEQVKPSNERAIMTEWEKWGRPKRYYGGASKSIQNDIDEFDDTDPEQVLIRQDDERDNRFFISNLDDIATPCYEQDTDYQDDRHPQENIRRRAE
jgi:hypothetical protein